MKRGRGLANWHCCWKGRLRCAYLLEHSQPRLHSRKCAGCCWRLLFDSVASPPLLAACHFVTHEKPAMVRDVETSRRCDRRRALPWGPWSAVRRPGRRWQCGLRLDPLLSFGAPLRTYWSAAPGNADRMCIAVDRLGCGRKQPWRRRVRVSCPDLSFSGELCCWPCGSSIWTIPPERAHPEGS